MGVVQTMTTPQRPQQINRACHHGASSSTTLPNQTPASASAPRHATVESFTPLTHSSLSKQIQEVNKVPFPFPPVSFLGLLTTIAEAALASKDNAQRFDDAQREQNCRLTCQNIFAIVQIDSL